MELSLHSQTALSNTDLSFGNERRKELDADAKVALKLALSSMLIAVGTMGASEGVRASPVLSTVPVTSPGCKTGIPTFDTSGNFAGCENDGGGANPTPPGNGGTGGGGSGTAPTLAVVSVTARSLKCQIKAQNWNNVEYLGFVIQGPNGPVATAVVQGGDIVAVENALNQLGITPSQVIAMVHNHPFAVYCTAKGFSATDRECILNNSPSLNDWHSAYNYLKSNGASNFGQYIVGPDGNLRFFSPGNQIAPPSPSTPPGSITGSGSC